MTPEIRLVSILNKIIYDFAAVLEFHLMKCLPMSQLYRLERHNIRKQPRRVSAWRLTKVNSI